MRFRIHFAIACLILSPYLAYTAPVALFDGKTFEGWEGNTKTVWRIIDGVIVGGSLEGNPQNEFLASTKSYKNFHLRFDYKIVGTEGFVNGGMQFRSKRIVDPSNEMSGYQADIGAGYSGYIYDESRRRKFLAEADQNFVKRLEKLGDWNHCEVVTTGRQILVFINGQRTAIWVENEPDIEQSGKIALQIHGNCKAEISFRNISINELPDSAVPPQGEILSRFGKAQPGSPLAAFDDSQFAMNENEVIVMVGQENFVREQKSGELEAMLASAFASRSPRFRSMAWEADTVYDQWRDLNFGEWAEQIEAAGATMVISQFGQIEALDGTGRLAEFTTAYHRLLDQFAGQTKRMVLVSPMPFEKPNAPMAPDLTQRNDDVAAYSNAIASIARQRGAVFVDLFTPLSQSSPNNRLTTNGIHLTETGLREVAKLIVSRLGGSSQNNDLTAIREAVIKKNQLWFDCWRPANWSFVYGDRVNQMYGKAAGLEPSLQDAFERQLPFVEAADDIVHALARGETAGTLELPKPILSPEPELAPLSPAEQMATFTMDVGYEVNLFASEEHGVVNPVQFSWDEKGRLYVACSPSYPQSLASAEPSDYILVCEDTDRDGRADKSWRFAEGLTMVQGVEPGAGGVYVCDFDRLLHLRDTNDDGKADEHHVVFSGFGIGDTHQLINSICHGPDGSLWFSQGLHAMSRVETPWGIARLDRAAIWRFQPSSMRLEGFFGGGMAGANCWGVAFDDFGQVFHKTGDRPQGYWSVPGMVRGANPSGSGSETEASASYRNSPEQYHSVGALFDTSPKTTALDIIGTQGMPEEIQGSALIGGYFGAVVELHRFEDAGSGFKTSQLPKLMISSNNAFRPVDVSVGPDGALYLADWYNPIIGHYQASYADPRRDKSHGRIWRITSKQHQSIVQPDLASMTPSELLDQLRSPERWTRYQAKRLLFDLSSESVLSAADSWVARTSNERHLLEVTGVFEAHDAPRLGLLKKLLHAKDPRVRAYGARVAGMWATRLSEGLELLSQSVDDENARVRLESVVAATYLPKAESVKVVVGALDHARDPFLDYAIRTSARALQPYWAEAFASNQLTVGNDIQHNYLRDLLGEQPAPPSPGAEMYTMACLACHQPEGKGLPGVYPPLEGSEWVSATDPSKLIKIVLHGLSGPIKVSGQTYGNQPGAVPMPAMSGLNDQQIADVLTFVRETYGQNADPITADEVKEIRTETRGRTKPWTAAEILSF
jgi:putative membrane-bound dehydrogenase-like protein